MAEGDECFRDVLLGPGGKVWRAIHLGFDEFGELGFGVGVIPGSEDAEISPANSSCNRPRALRPVIRAYLPRIFAV